MNTTTVIIENGLARMATGQGRQTLCKMRTSAIVRNGQGRQFPGKISTSAIVKNGQGRQLPDKQKYILVGKYSRAPIKKIYKRICLSPAAIAVLEGFRRDEGTRCHTVLTKVAAAGATSLDDIDLNYFSSSNAVDPATKLRHLNLLIKFFSRLPAGGQGRHKSSILQELRACKETLAVEKKDFIKQKEDASIELEADVSVASQSSSLHTNAAAGSPSQASNAGAVRVTLTHIQGLDVSYGDLMAEVCCRPDVISRLDALCAAGAKGTLSLNDVSFVRAATMLEIIASNGLRGDICKRMRYLHWTNKTACRGEADETLYAIASPANKIRCKQLHFILDGRMLQHVKLMLNLNRARKRITQGRTDAQLEPDDFVFQSGRHGKPVVFVNTLVQRFLAKHGMQGRLQHVHVIRNVIATTRKRAKLQLKAAAGEQTVAGADNVAFLMGHSQKQHQKYEQLTKEDGQQIAVNGFNALRALAKSSRTKGTATTEQGRPT